MEKFELSENDLKEIEKRLKEGKTKLEKMVTEYPLTSVAAAFVLGYLVSKLFNSKD